MKIKKNITTYPTDYFHVNDLIMRLTGFATLPRKCSLVLKRLYICYSIIVSIICIAFLSCELYFIKETMSNPQKLVSQIGLLFTHIVGLGKLACVVIYKEELEIIKKGLQESWFEENTMENFRPGLMMHQEKIYGTKLCTFIAVWYTFVGISAHVAATISITNSVSGEYFPDNVTCYDFMPYYFYIPFEAASKWQCQKALIFMDAAIIFYAWYILNLDCLYLSLLNSLKANFNVLCQAFTTVRKRCLFRLGLPGDFSVLYDETYPEVEEEMYKDMKRCVKCLIHLLDICDAVENIFSYITLAQTVGALAIFASALFVVSKIPTNSPEFFSVIEYFVALFVQFSVYCWFGNELTLASDNISYSVYCSDWLSCSKRFKQSMLMTMAKMKRPVFITVGKFTPLTISTLVGVLRASFSYFTVFKGID